MTDSSESMTRQDVISGLGIDQYFGVRDIHMPPGRSWFDPRSAKSSSSAAGKAGSHGAPDGAFRPAGSRGSDCGVSSPRAVPEPPQQDHVEEAQPRRPVAIDVPDDADKTTRLAAVAEHVAVCEQCGLEKTRTNTVPGQGNPDARIVFVGEAPGADEDRQGIPFVGRAGKLLTDIIEKGMKISRDDVFICNVLKCRPPNNRTPNPQEIGCCKPYLWRQLEIISPEVIIALGAPASQTLLETRDSIGRLRGRFHDLPILGADGNQRVIKVMPTYHPAYLLRNPSDKKKVWEDIKQVLSLLDM